jgi:Zn-dependent peptidase ImmA (M78 family)/DNA-binding XRE family transcriptional regulator
MIGLRLKRAREASGLSLRELEALINREVSAQAIGKYERDEMMPSSTVLLSLAKALKVSPDFLLSDREIELSGIDFRKAPHAAAKEEKAVNAAVLDHMERYLELEELMPDPGANWVELTFAEFCIGCIDDAEVAADRLRQLWQLGIDPIPNFAELIEEKGVKVIALDLPPNISGSKAFISISGRPDAPIIVVNCAHNGERQRFTMAHELAHLVLQSDSLNERDQERAADRFAGAFLMAKEMLLSILGGYRQAISLGEFIELKKIFKVSVACIAVRCSQIGAISKALYGKLFGQIRALGWNDLGSDEPAKLEPELPQRMERLCLRAIAEGAISLSKAAELLKVNLKDVDRLLARGA